MFIVEVVPITKGLLKSSLSYFSPKEITPGSLVEIPLRKKTVQALVVSSKDAREVKSDLRQADYSVKKIGQLKAKSFLSKEFIQSAEEVARYFAGGTGTVLNNTIPKFLLENFEKLKIKNNLKDVLKKDSHEKLLIQASDDERYSTYKRLIREEFAKNCSVLFIVPSIEEVEKARSFLDKGIENYTFSLSSNLTKKDLIDTFNKIFKESHSVLVIATAQYMCLPRPDFNIIILDKEQNSSYKQLIRPYLDMRTFAEIFAKTSGTKILMGDLFLRTETIWREKNLEFSDISPLKFRSISTAEQKLVSIKKEKGQDFSPLSQELQALIKKGIDNKENTFILCSRKGLNPIIQCNDCGENIKCPNCSAPSVLHQEGKNRFLLCHKCGYKRDVLLKCENCHSWRLEPLGIGIELLEEEIKKIFPEISTIRIDKESAKTPKQIQSKIKKFYENKGSVLIATEMALPYLREEVDNVICASIDSFLSIPDFRINEKMFSLLLKMRSLAKGNFLIQTRYTELKIWQNVIDGNLADFYREEIDNREMLSYPPFSTLIKITIQGQKESAQKEAEKLAEIFGEFKPHVYPSFISKVKGKYIMNVLLKLDKGSWPNKNLLQKIYSLSPKLAVRVDPDSIL